MLDDVLVDCLHLRLAPVHRGDFFQVWQLSAQKPDDARVMHPCQRVSVFHCDRVVRGQPKFRVPDIRHQLHVRHNTAPSIQDVQACECSRHDGFQIQWLIHKCLMSTDEDESGCAAVQSSPPQSRIDSILDLGHTLHPVKLCQMLRRDRTGQRKPVFGHVVRDDAHDVLHNPVIAVQAVEQRIVVG